MGFNLIYWNPMSGSYFLYGSILEKYGNFRKNGRFSGRIWPDWGNTTWADMAGLGSIGLRIDTSGESALFNQACVRYSPKEYDFYV